MACPKCGSEGTTIVLANSKLYCRKCHFIGTENGLRSNPIVSKISRIITSEMRRRAAAAPHGFTSSEKAAIQRYLSTNKIRRSEIPVRAKNSILPRYE